MSISLPRDAGDRANRIAQRLHGPYCTDCERRRTRNPSRICFDCLGDRRCRSCRGTGVDRNHGCWPCQGTGILGDPSDR
jgi:hypothetical protein